MYKSKENNKTEWILDSWMDKAMYAIGFGYSVIFVAYFIVGFFDAL